MLVTSVVTLGRRFLSRGQPTSKNLLRIQAYIACIHETRAEFFEGLYPPSSATAHLYDPPLPLDSRIGYPPTSLNKVVTNLTARPA